jgi:hypothetical protein
MPAEALRYLPEFLAVSAAFTRDLTVALLSPVAVASQYSGTNSSL